MRRKIAPRTEGSDGGSYCYVVQPGRTGRPYPVALVDEATRDRWVQQYRDRGAVCASLETALATGTHIARCYAWEPPKRRWWAPWRRKGRWREVGSVLLRDGEALGATCRKIAANE